MSTGFFTDGLLDNEIRSWKKILVFMQKYSLAIVFNRIITFFFNENSIFREKRPSRVWRER